MEFFSLCLLEIFINPWNINFNKNIDDDVNQKKTQHIWINVVKESHKHVQIVPLYLRKGWKKNEEIAYILLY